MLLIGRFALAHTSRHDLGVRSGNITGHKAHGLALPSDSFQHFELLLTTRHVLLNDIAAAI